MVGWVASLVAIADGTTTEHSSDFSCQTVLFCVQFFLCCTKTCLPV